MRRSFLLALLAFAVACIFMAATPAMAVHKAAGALRCGACHTMHSSQGNDTTIGGATGSLILLRGGVESRADIHNLCLDCHSDAGSQDTVSFSESSTAPKVHFNSGGGDGVGAGPSPFDFKEIGAAGDFGEVFTYASGSITLITGDTSANYSLGHGHSLGATNVVPPGALTGETTAITLSCTNCHDPHGVTATSSSINVYRNLKKAPTGGGGGTAADGDGGVTLTTTTPWGGASSGTDFTGTNAGAENHYWPIYDGTSQNAYPAGSDASVTAGMSGWCAQCHDNWHEDSSGNTNEETNDWRRHPVHNVMVDGSTTSGAGVTIVAWTHYNERADSTEAPYTNTTGTKLPAANAAGNAVYYGDDSDDKVMCLSCHFAHGGPWFDALRWDYTSGVSAGGQTGNQVASNVGCQQCHNK
jgi:hypothetical protein